MGRAVKQIRELVGPLDPMKDAVDVAAPEFDFTQTDPHDTVRPIRSSRRSVLAVAAAAVVLTAGGLVWNSVGPSTPKGYARTPPPLVISPATDGRPAAGILAEIATKAAASGVPQGQPGQTEHLKMSSWYLDGAVKDGDTVSATVLRENESWRRADDSGKKISREGAPAFETDADRQKWGNLGLPLTSTEGATEDISPGGFGGMWQGRPPTNADALRIWLQKGQDWNAMQTYSAITDLLRERVLLPQERAAVLRLVAELPDVRYDGETHDRAGRPGQAFSFDSAEGGLPARHTLVIDPANGVILANEEMLTMTAGKLNVRIPAVIEYETYLRAELQP